MNEPTTAAEIDTTVPPTIENVIEWLKEIADVAAIDPDQDLEEQEVDSLDLIELAAAIEDMYGLAFDESLLEKALTDRTLREVYTRVIGHMGFASESG